MRKIVIAVLLLLVAPATTAAQWNIEESVDPFTDESTHTASLVSEENQLSIGYSCTDGQESLYVGLWIGHEGADLFADGDVQIRFDDDPAERAEWLDENTLLFSPNADAFARRMAQHQILLVGVTAFRNDLVRDRFDLTGTAAMLEQIDCGESAAQ